MSRVEIETDCAVFLKSIMTWDGQTPEFRSVVASAIFHAFRCRRSETFTSEMRTGLEVPTYAIARWASGSQPGPNMSRAAVTKIAELISRYDAEHREENARDIRVMRGIGSLPDH